MIWIVWKRALDAAFGHGLQARPVIALVVRVGGFDDVRPCTPAHRWRPSKERSSPRMQPSFPAHESSRLPVYCSKYIMLIEYRPLDTKVMRTFSGMCGKSPTNRVFRGKTKRSAGRAQRKRGKTPMANAVCHRSESRDFRLFSCLVSVRKKLGGEVALPRVRQKNHNGLARVFGTLRKLGRCPKRRPRRDAHQQALSP